MLAINQKYHKIHSIVIHYRKKNVFTQKSNINRRVLFPQSYCIVITTTNQYQSFVLSRTKYMVTAHFASSDHSSSPTKRQFQTSV